MSRRSLLLATLLAAVPSLRADAPPLDTDQKKISYVIGRQLGENLRSQGIMLDLTVFAASVGDAEAGRPAVLTPDEQKAVLQGLQKSVEAYMKTQGEKTKKDGKAFLSANKKKKGVKVTKSGLQYRIDQPGTGASPKASDVVRVNYRGTLIDGTEFDSSYKHGKPVEFPLGQVIKGWTEGIQLLKVGSKATLFVPAELAYGENGAPPAVPGNSTLVFEVELLDIVK